MRLLTGLLTEHLNPSILRWKSTTGKYPADNYMFKVNNRNTRTMCEICLKFKLSSITFPFQNAISKYYCAVVV